MKSRLDMFQKNKRGDTANYLGQHTFNVSLINGIILVFTSVLASFILFSGIPILNSYIVPIFYANIILLVSINWNRSPHIRKAILFSSILILLSVMGPIFYPAYTYDFYLRIILIFLGMVTIASIEIGPRMLKIQTLIFVIILALVFAKSFGYYDSFTAGNPISGDLDFRNPNSYAFLALIAALYLDRSSLAKSKLFRILLLLVAIITLTNYSSRTSLLCIVSYLLINYLLRNYTKLSRKFIYFSVVFAAAIFPIIYVGLYEKSVTDNTNYTIMGKDMFSGRQELWALTKQESNVIPIMLGQPDGNLPEGVSVKDWHNMYLLIWHNSGLLYSVILILFIYYCIVKNKDLKQKTFSYLIVIMIFGFFETAFISGGIIAMLALLTFVNYDSSQKNRSNILIENGI